MNIALSYIYVLAPSDPGVPNPDYYVPFAQRFFDSYNQFKPGIVHRVHVAFTGRVPTGDDYYAVRQMNPPPHHSHFVFGGGKDIGAHQRMAFKLGDLEDFVVFFATVAYLWKPGWLERLVQAREKYGDGLYGPMASYENSPHIRTSCFACSPKLLREYPVQVDSVEKAIMFESCQGGFTDWVRKQGLPCKMVTWDGEYDMPDWRKPANVFRLGDQSQCLTRDRYTDQYDAASPAEKAELKRRADTGR